MRWPLLVRGRRRGSGLVRECAARAHGAQSVDTAMHADSIDVCVCEWLSAAGQCRRSVLPGFAQPETASHSVTDT